MRRYKYVPIFVALLFGAVFLLGQPLQDPWHRPLNMFGGSDGITYGTLAPSLATTGENPGQGEVWVDTDGATDGGPIMNVYDHVTGVWDAQLNSAALTAGTIPVFNGTELVDSTVDDDLTDVVATGGLFTAGSAVDAADSILLDGNNDTFQFEGGTADAGEIMFVAVDPATDVTLTMDNPAAGAGSGTWFELAAAWGIQDVGVTLRALHIDMDSPANHLGATATYAIDLDNDTDTVAGEEVALHFTANWDAELHFAADQATIWWLDTGSLLIQDYGGAIDLILTDMPDHAAADSTVHAMELDVTMDAMDALDVQSGIFIDVTNAAHAAGTLYGLNIDGIVAQGAEETAIFVGATWDIDIHFGSATALVNWFQTGTLEFSDYGQDNEIIFSDIAADNDPPVPTVELDPTLSIMDAGGDAQAVLYLDIDNVNHSNGWVYGIHLDLDLGDAQASEFGILFNNQWDADIAYQNNDSFIIQDVGAAGVGANNFILTDVPVAGTAGDLMELDVVLSAMDGAGDIFQGILLDIENADHTNGFLYGLTLDLDVGDAEATEIAMIVTGATWDEVMRISGGGNIVIGNNSALTFRDVGAAANLTLTDIPAAGTAADVVEIDFTPAAMDGAGDIFRGLLMDVNGAADHTNGFIRGIDMDLATDDAQSLEAGIWFNATWDGALVIEHQAGAPAENPPAGWVMLTIDDNADYSGGGGNDCALVARTSAGANVGIGTIVLNGVCP